MIQDLQTDVLVIGAGPSGTVAASIIQQQGYHVTIVEKMQFPRFVIGESLLPRCMEALEGAGFLEAIKAKQFQQKDGAKFVMGDDICDFNFSQQYTNGWKWTWQVPRAEFDKVLADTCEQKGITILYEHEVTGIQFLEDESSITTIKDKEGKEQTIKAKFIVDGSGYGRVIPRLFNLDKPSSQPPRKTVFCHIADPKRDEFYEPNRIIAYIHNQKTWVWVIPFSNGYTSLGFVSDPEYFDQFKGDVTEQYRQLIDEIPELKRRFENAELKWETPKSLQSWSVSTDRFYGKGFVLTGNVTEFLDPIFSSGVTLATVSAQLAAQLVVKKLKGEMVDWEKEYMEVMKQGVGVFRTFVNAWYEGDLFHIFFSEKRDEKIMAQICSVLAGYVWDETNPFVKNHEKHIRTLSRFLSNQQTAAS